MSQQINVCFTTVVGDNTNRMVKTIKFKFFANKLFGITILQVIKENFF